MYSIVPLVSVDAMLGTSDLDSTYVDNGKT
jgi:hypothetical protein